MPADTFIEQEYGKEMLERVVASVQESLGEPMPAFQTGCPFDDKFIYKCVMPLYLARGS